MADMNDASRVYQDHGVYTTPASQEVHILYGGPNQDPVKGDGHGHAIYNIPGDYTRYDRPPA